MLRVNLAGLAAGPVDVDGSIEPAAEVFEDVDFRVIEPVRVHGRLTESGPGSYFWRGSVQVGVDLTCRRCLRPTRHSVDERLEVLFTEDASTDDPAAYTIPENASELEFEPMVREELILAVPRYPLCRENCLGLCSNCGKELNDGPCGCVSNADPRWAVLEALKAQGGPKET